MKGEPAPALRGRLREGEGGEEVTLPVAVSQREIEGVSGNK